MNVFQKIVVLMIVVKYNVNFNMIASFVNTMANVKKNTKNWWVRIMWTNTDYELAEIADALNLEKEKVGEDK